MLMIRKQIFRFCQNWKSGKKVIDPTMAESFGTKFSEEEVEKILDPKGFLDLKEYKDYDGIEDIGK